MSKLLSSVVWRAARSAIAIWVAAQVAHQVWFAPILLAAGKALRDKFPGKEGKPGPVDWLPI